MNTPIESSPPGIVAGAAEILVGAEADASALIKDSDHPAALISKVRLILANAPTEIAGVFSAVLELERRIIALEAKIAS
jgi:hypothetical protein